MLVVPLYIIVDLSEMAPVSVEPELMIIHFIPLQLSLSSHGLVSYFVEVM